MATELNLNNKRLACTPESGFDVTPGRPGNASRTDSSSRRSPRRRRRHRRRRRQLLRDTGPGRAWVLPRPWRPGSGRRGRIITVTASVPAAVLPGHGPATLRHGPATLRLAHWQFRRTRTVTDSESEPPSRLGTRKWPSDSGRVSGCRAAVARNCSFKSLARHGPSHKFRGHSVAGFSPDSES